MDVIDHKKSYIAGQFRVFSISYGLFACLIGSVLNTIEPFKGCAGCHNPIKVSIEVFYIFMQTVSIFWLVIMFCLITTAKRKSKVAIQSTKGQSKRLLSVQGTEAPVFERLKRTLSFSKKNSIPNGLSNGLSNSEPGKNHVEFTADTKNNNNSHETMSLNSSNETSERMSLAESIYDLSKFHYTYDYNNGTGELYMRCGIAIFSVCALIDRCLNIVQMAEVYINEKHVLDDCQLTFTVTMISVCTSIVFIFFQSFFIFKYANIIINYGKNASVIGIMHIVSTNFCITLRTIVQETVSEIREYNHNHAHQSNDIHKRSLQLYPALEGTQGRSLYEENNSTSFQLPNEKQSLGCIGMDQLKSDVVLYVQNAQRNLDSYLFPCIIEYSLMSMTVFFILWSGIEQRYYISRHPEHTSHHRHNRRTEIRTTNSFTVDCGKSTTGLFFGILVLLVTIIALITYFIYHDHNELMAVTLSELIEFFLLSMSFLIVLAIFFKLKYHKFKSRIESGLDYNSILTIIGLAGIYMYGFYSIIAILNNNVSSKIENLFLTIHILSIIESTMQSILIINCLKMYTNKHEFKMKKPGRSLIILLILIDVSLWLVETLCVKKYDMSSMQLDYYDIVFWSIVSSISSPLAIFFRFHASVCLSDVWKTLYE